MSKPSSNVERLYRQMREMAADFAFKPDERINESELASRLGASRTPMREALNRLAAEGFLTFQSGRGFFCRPLTPSRILELYEARVAIECEGLRLSCARAQDDQIHATSQTLDDVSAEYSSCMDAGRLLAIDEDFHMSLIALSGNSELVSMLKNLNDRIRYIRLIDLQRMREKAGEGQGNSLHAHRRILTALADHDCVQAVEAMRDHITRRQEEATEAVRIAYSQLYVPAD